MTRWSGKEIAIRGVTATVAGYALVALWCAVLARILPMPKLDATLSATMLSFPLYAIVAIWVFASRSMGRFCIGGAIVALIGLALLKGVAA